VVQVLDHIAKEEMKRLDTNLDGEVILEELEEYVRKVVGV
jgi:hypothetical protein